MASVWHTPGLKDITDVCIPSTYPLDEARNLRGWLDVVANSPPGTEPKLLNGTGLFPVKLPDGWLRLRSHEGIVHASCIVVLSKEEI